MIYFLGMLFGFSFCVSRRAFDGEPPVKKALLYAVMSSGWFLIPAALVIDLFTGSWPEDKNGI